MSIWLLFLWVGPAVMRNGETRKGADYNRKSGTYTPAMPSSFLTSLLELLQRPVIAVVQVLVAVGESVLRLIPGAGGRLAHLVQLQRGFLALRLQLLNVALELCLGLTRALGGLLLQPRDLAVGVAHQLAAVGHRLVLLLRRVRLDLFPVVG